MINYFQGYEALKLKDDTSLQEMTQDKWLLLGRGNSDSYDFITLRLKIGKKISLLLVLCYIIIFA